MMGMTLQKVIYKYFPEKQFSKTIANRRLQRSGKHYQGNWGWDGVVRASCFPWDKRDKDAPQVAEQNISATASPPQPGAEQGRPGGSRGNPKTGHRTPLWGWGRDEASLGHRPAGGGQDPKQGGEPVSPRLGCPCKAVGMEQSFPDA